MKNVTRTIIFALIAIGAFVVLAPTTAKATGTLSGTVITNTATVNYEVDGLAQELIESSPTGNTTAGIGAGTATTFVVDNVVDVTVATTDGTYVAVQPGGTDYVLTFTVFNAGNTEQDYELSVTHGNDPFAAYAADTFDATPLDIYVESNGLGGYQTTDSALTYIDALSADDTATVYIVGDIPGGATNGQISGIVLTATTHDSTGAGLDALTIESGAADQAQTVDVVFNDGAGADASENDAAGDGAHASTSAYKVGVALLTITKTETLISSPVTNAGGFDVHMPGAVVEYEIIVANGALGATATNITLTDTLDGNLTFETGTYDGVGGCAAPCGVLLDAAGMTNATDGDQGEWDGAIVTVDGITLAGGASATITYRATVD